jgi:hypothetical protein
MGSVLPGCGDSSSDSRGRVSDDTESPRRKLDKELRKSDDVELDLECEMLPGVMGGVTAPLLCILRGSCAPMVNDRFLAGEVGGVERVRTGTGLEDVLSDTVIVGPWLDVLPVSR